MPVTTKLDAAVYVVPPEAVAEIERLRAALRTIIQRGTGLSQGDQMPVYIDAMRIAEEALGQ